VRSQLVAAGLALAAAAPGWAQLPHLLPPDAPWQDVNYPKLFWTPREGLTAGGYLAFIRPLSFDDTSLPPPYAGAVSLDGQLSASGSRYLTLEGRFPWMVPGWRLAVSLSAARRTRENYFGIGNDTPFDESLVTDTQEHYYHARQVRWLGRGELQRRVAGGLRLLAGIHAERWRVAPVEPASLLATHAAAGVDPTIGQSVNDLTGRVGVVFDTRDDEVAANTGVLLEFIHAGTVGGDLTYTRTTGSAAGYLTVGENLLLAARAVGQRMGGTPRLGAYALIEASDRPYTGLGGALSHRALPETRLLGRHKLLLNVDARYHVFNLPRTARLTLAAFFDAGRVFESEEFRITTEDLAVGGGLALYLQFTRAGILGTTVGLGPDGVVLDVATRWTY
jgi:hypothetical protein